MNWVHRKPDSFVITCCTLCGLDGSLPARYEPLILPPQTSVEEALMLLELHEGTSALLPDD